MRAAAMGLTAIVRGDVSGTVNEDGAVSDSTFDTGNQRPS
jgi:hypothetical protein